MEENLCKLKKEFLKANNQLRVSVLIFFTSFILLFFYKGFVFVSLISLVICILNNLRLNDIKTKLVNQGIESNLLIKNTKKQENESKEDIKELENKNIIIKENIEESDELEDILNERLLESTEIYLESFNYLEKYNMNKELDEAFIKKITRTKEMEYENFIKPIGTTDKPMNFVVFDLETTGLNAIDNEIIEIGAVRFNTNKPVELFHTFIKPKKKITKRITSINGVSNEMVENCPTIEEVIPRFIDFIGDNVLIAHNSDFDMGFILNQLYNQGYKKIKNKVIDTLNLSRQKVREYDFETDRNKKLNSYKLENLKYAFDLWEVSSHNAIDDCKVCAYVYLKIKNEYGGFCYVD